MAVTLVLSACSGTPGGGTPDNATPASTTPASATPAGASPASASPGRAATPFALTYTRDDSRAVSKRVEAEDGGTLEVTNAAGDLIRLQIQRDTLYFDETITLTPLEGLSGIDGATRLIGVAMEPAGVEFTSPAVLVVTPRDALAGEVWWFESPPGSDGRRARPALPIEGHSGMTVWHFSTGAVAAGGQGLSDAVRSRAPGEITPLSERVSSEFLDWRRNQAEQDYQAGRIDRIKRDSDLATIQDLKEQLAAEAIEAKSAEIYKSLDEGTAKSTTEVKQAEEVARRGDPKDIDALTKIMNDALANERQSQLLGRPEGELGRRAMELMNTYAEAIAANCGKRRDMGLETVQFMLSFERAMQLMGADADGGDRPNLGDCLKREWAGAERKEGNYGLVSISVKKSGCSVGIYGKYVYAVSGAVKGEFEFEVKEPRDNFVAFAPFTLRADVAPRWTERTYSCTQSGEVTIGMPPGAFFQATARPGRCAGGDDLSGDGIVETTAFPVRAGPLCK